MAYAGRYGKQPLDVLLAMSVCDLVKFNRAVSKIVKEENGSKGGDL